MRGTLPLRAAIDSFSIGTLGKLITWFNKDAKSPSNEKPQLVKDLIANDLRISVKHFGITESVGILRNAVFHHQRLWMRPMPKSPGMPKHLLERYPGGNYKAENKSAQFVVLAVLSMFLPLNEREIYLTQLDEFLDNNKLFGFGIKNPLPEKQINM